MRLFSAGTRLALLQFLHGVCAQTRLSIRSCAIAAAPDSMPVLHISTLFLGASRKAAESNARQRAVKSIEAKTALPNAHFFLLCPFTHGESMQSVAAMDLHSPKIP